MSTPFVPKSWSKEPITRADLDRHEQGIAAAHAALNGIQYREVGGQLQWSVDGGATWRDAGVPSHLDPVARLIY